MRALLLTAIAAAVLVYAAAPPRVRSLPPPPAQIAEPVRGVFHIHTRRSDGSGTVEQVAEAAARAGLRFIVLTDHGDATRAPDAPWYYGGVLVIDAVEISTFDGHVTAIGLGRSPYQLAGEARDVVEDVRRMGGMAIAAHPGSPKRDLRWTDWSVPVHGLEHMNGDSEWRDEPAWQLARALLAYPVRPAETLALVLDRGDEVLRHWDAMTRTRRVVALAGADAHGRLGLRAQEPYRGRLALPVPGYESVFRSASIALPEARLSSDAATDAKAIVDEIRAGRVFSSVDALGSQPRFAFTATSGGSRATGGDTLVAGGPVQIEAVVQAPPGVEMLLLRNGERVAASGTATLRYQTDGSPAAYRVEVNVPQAPGNPPVPWVVSNPIYVGRTDADPIPPPRLAATARSDLYTDGAAAEWTVEHSSPSQGAVDVVKAVAGTQLLLRYALSGAASTHPFAALVAPAGAALAGHDRITFMARADKPMRLSVQLRAPGSNSSGERWHRSVFVDSTAREISVWFDDMRPRGVTSTAKPPLDNVRWILFVVDTVNTPTGTAGQLFLDDVRYER